MNFKIITLSLALFVIIPTQQARANITNCEEALKEINFIHALMEDHLYVDWAMKNNPVKTRDHLNVIYVQSKGLIKYCQLKKPRTSQVYYRMGLINNAWNSIKVLAE